MLILAKILSAGQTIKTISNLDTTFVKPAIHSGSVHGQAGQTQAAFEKDHVNP